VYADPGERTDKLFKKGDKLIAYGARRYGWKASGGGFTDLASTSISW